MAPNHRQNLNNSTAPEAAEMSRRDRNLQLFLALQQQQQQQQQQQRQQVAPNNNSRPRRLRTGMVVRGNSVSFSCKNETSAAPLYFRPAQLIVQSSNFLFRSSSQTVSSPSWTGPWTSSSPTFARCRPSPATGSPCRYTRTTGW